MSVFALKLLAALFMLVDHVAILLEFKGILDQDFNVLMRCLGRFSFPIYAFLTAAGFRKLKGDFRRLRGHALLLAALAIASEPLYDGFLHGTFRYQAGQNVIFTLLLGFLGLWLAQQEENGLARRLFVYFVVGWVGYLISSDYRIPGVLLIFACYFCLEHFDSWYFGKRIAALLIVLILYYAFLCWVGCGFGGLEAVWKYLKAMGVYGIPHLLLVPLLASYNGKLGPRNRILHRCYQWLYPVHLGLLCITAALL